MDEQKDPLMMDHEYDGIKELDNKLPGWWLWLFYLSIIFSIGYIGYYHVLNKGKSQESKYEAEMAAHMKAGEIAAGGETVAASFPEEPSTDEAVLARGKEVYMANCLACHGPQGQGLVGPNLCDDYYIHGAAFADYIRIVREGVLAKGMIAWEPVLSPDDLYAVTSFVFGLQGSNPPNPKAPEGVQVQPKG